MSIGFSYCMKNKWLRFDKDSGMIQKLQEEADDEVAADLALLDRLDPVKLALYKKRKLVETR
jgi:hypothetical protein